MTGAGDVAGGDIRIGADATENAAALSAGTRGEVERVLVAAVGAIAKVDRPEPGKDDVGAGGILQCAQIGAGGGIVGVNETVAEVADQECVGIFAEGSRSDGEAPRRIQLAARAAWDEGLERAAGSVKDTDIAVAIAADIEEPGGVLFGVGDIEAAIDGPDVEGREACRDARINKGASGHVDRFELGVEYVDVSCLEVGGEEADGRGQRQGQALVG